MMAFLSFLGSASLPAGTSPPTFVLLLGAILGGTLLQTLIAIARDWWKYRKGEEHREFELDKAIKEAPLVQESLSLGNVDKAVTIQQGIIANLERHIKFQDAEMTKLLIKLDDRDKKIDSLERELNGVKTRLTAESSRVSKMEQELRNLRLSRN